jgi:hypothetical protein
MFAIQTEEVTGPLNFLHIGGYVMKLGGKSSSRVRASYAWSERYHFSITSPQFRKWQKRFLKITSIDTIAYYKDEVRKCHSALFAHACGHRAMGSLKE